MVLHARSGRRADAQPVEPQGIAAGNPVHGVKRQEFRQGFLLSAIGHVALILGDDQRQPRDLGGKVAQLDPSEVGDRNFRAPVGLVSPFVDLGLDGTHFLVGDDKEVARSAGRVENPDLGDAVAQVQKLARVVARLFQLLAQVIERKAD